MAVIQPNVSREKMVADSTGHPSSSSNASYLSSLRGQNHSARKAAADNPHPTEYVTKYANWVS